MLVWVRAVASWRRLWDTMCTWWRDYRHGRFVRADLRLWLRYRWCNPYAISRKYHRTRGEDPYQYGETLLSTLAKVMHRSKVRRGARVYELGCGTGRTALWLHLVAGCDVVGIEQVPEFVARATQLAGLEIRHGDYLTTDYSEADMVYLYGTTLNDQQIRRLLQAFDTLRSSARVVTVSYPLTEYAPNQYVIIDEMEALFPWGRASIYLQQKL